MGAILAAFGQCGPGEGDGLTHGTRQKVRPVRGDYKLVPEISAFLESPECGSKQQDRGHGAMHGRFPQKLPAKAGVRGEAGPPKQQRMGSQCRQVGKARNQEGGGVFGEGPRVLRPGRWSDSRGKQERKAVDTVPRARASTGGFRQGQGCRGQKELRNDPGGQACRPETSAEPILLMSLQAVHRPPARPRGRARTNHTGTAAPPSEI